MDTTYRARFVQKSNKQLLRDSKILVHCEQQVL